MIRDARTTKGIGLKLFMQGTYQLDRETIQETDAELMFNDTCQVRIIFIFLFDFNAKLIFYLGYYERFRNT